MAIFIYNDEELTTKGENMGRDGEAEIIELIKDLQRRMTYLEKKIDTLMQQSADKPPASRNFSQGSRTYGGPQRYNEQRENRFGAKNERPGRSFKNKRSTEDRGIPKKRKPFNPAGRQGAKKKNA